MQSLTTKTLKIFWTHAKKYPWHLLVVSLGVLIHATLQNYYPILYKQLIDALVNGDKTNIEPLINIVKIIFYVSMIRFFVARIFNFVNNFFQPKVMADLNITCFNYIHKHSFAFFANNFVGSLVTKVKRYERAFETIADQITFDLGRTILEIVLILGILFYQNTQIGIITLVWLVFYVSFSYFYSLYKLPVDIKRAEADSLITGGLADTITNNSNIKIFSSYKNEEKSFTNLALNQFKIRKKSWDLGTVSDAVQGASMILVEFVALYYCVKLWQTSEITIGTIALVQSYYFRIFDKSWNMGKNIRSIYEAIADANETTQILLTPHEVQDIPNANQLKVTSGLIEFQDVAFKYHTKVNVLNKFNLKINPLEKVALIGPSGDGKTTITKLLLRFTDIQSGEIKIDGQNISQVTQDSLRSKIAFVPQDPILFHRSLMENIRYGKPNATDQEVKAAAKIAHAHEFIEKCKDGYNTLVGERGIKLSGGERQRVAIARAVLKNSPILVLDEATSALDSESEFFIQDALKKLMENKTVIVIAHRLSTIMQMDRIIVLENGKIIEQGKHEELLKAKQGTYQKLWNIQAGGFSS
jgi:ATP-binding cassette subfamily B protein